MYCQHQVHEGDEPLIMSEEAPMKDATHGLGPVFPIPGGAAGGTTIVLFNRHVPSSHRSDNPLVLLLGTALTLQQARSLRHVRMERRLATEQTLRTTGNVAAPPIIAAKRFAQALAFGFTAARTAAPNCSGGF